MASCATVLQQPPETSKSKVPSFVSYCTVKSATVNLLFQAKLHFFAFVARKLKPFLETFQTDATMVPLVAKELQSILRHSLSCFIQNEELEKTKTPIFTSQTNQSTYVPLKVLDTDFVTNENFS